MEERKILVGKINEIAPGQIKRFKMGFRDAILVHTGGTLKAYYDFCTHQGGRLKLEDGCFRCLRHGATFDIVSGARASGEAPEGSFLTEIPLRIEGEDIFVFWQLPE